MFLWVPVHSKAVPETNTESWSEEWFQGASVREQEGKMCNTRDTFQNLCLKKGMLEHSTSSSCIPEVRDSLPGGGGWGSGRGNSSDCRTLSVHLAAGRALASRKEALRIESRMTHSMFYGNTLLLASQSATMWAQVKPLYWCTSDHCPLLAHWTQVEWHQFESIESPVVALSVEKDGGAMV